MWARLGLCASGDARCGEDGWVAKMQFLIFIAFLTVLAYGIWAGRTARKAGQARRVVIVWVSTIALLVGLFVCFLII